MNRIRRTSLTLAVVLGAGSWGLVSPAALADQPAPQQTVQAQQAPEAVQAQQPTAGASQVQQDSKALQSPPQGPQAGQTQQCAAAQQGERMKFTGSNISRPRSDCSLPLVTLDRGYIDQSGALTTGGVVRSYPAAQNFGH